MRIVRQAPAPGGRLARHGLIGLLVLAAVASPAIEGALSAYQPYILIAAGLLGLATILGLGAAPKISSAVQSAALAASMLGLSITAFDLAGRLFIPDILSVRPDNRYIERWPPYPRVDRLAPNVVYDHTLYGDLALFTGVPTDRDPRQVRFLTDAYGFRNTPPVAAPVDLVLLGDSFAMGSGTTQDQTLAADLGRSGLSVYNMGVGGASPWQEYINFVLELGRIHPRPGGTLVWLLYPGNDLEDVYGPADLAQIPWRGMLGQAEVIYDTFRNSSPLAQLTEQIGAGSLAGMVDRETFPNGRPMLFYKPQAREAKLSLADVESHGNFPRLVDSITLASQFAQANGLNVLLVVVPTKDEVYSWLYHGDPPWSSGTEPSGFSQAISKVSANLGLCFLDLKPAFVEQSRSIYQQTGQSLYWYDDTHWNAVGQQLAAQILLTRRCRAPGSALCCG